MEILEADEVSEGAEEITDAELLVVDRVVLHEELRELRSEKVVEDSGSIISGNRAMSKPIPPRPLSALKVVEVRARKAPEIGS